MKLSMSALLLASVLLAPAAPASAGTVTTVTYQGTIRAIGGPLVTNGAFYLVGEAVTFNFAYDDESLQDSVVDAHTGSYRYVKFTGSFLGSTYADANSRTLVRDDHADGDRLDLTALRPLGSLTSGGLELRAVTLVITDSTKTAFADAQLSNAWLSLALFDSADFTLSFAEGIAVGRLSSASVTVTQTPVPAALPLLVSALGALGFMGWTRRRTAVASR